MPNGEKSTIQQFMELAPQLIADATAYAGQTESNPGVDADIRKLKVMCAALMAALQAIKV